MKVLRYLLLLSLHMLCSTAFPQMHYLQFDHFGTDDGLSQSNVLCLYQDSHGFMWFGTQDGLNKYDGYTFTVYKNDPSRKNSLSNNHVTDIAEDSNGDLWIATWGGGLNKYDRRKDEFIHFKHDAKNPNSISDDFITCLLKDSKGNIWVGTSNGINVFDKKNNCLIKYTNSSKDHNSISDNYATTIYEDKEHNIWIGTNTGLNLFDPEKKSFTHFQQNDNNPGSLSSNSITSIFEDSKHRLWIGTNGGGFNLFDKQSGKFRAFEKNNTKANGLCDNVVFSITEDNDGMIWIASENNGISLFSPVTETFTNYAYSGITSTDLSSNSINRIYKDNKGNIWIGTYNAGINLLSRDATKFVHYKHTTSLNSLGNNNVLCLYEDRENNLWVATDGGGLDLYDKGAGKFKHFKHEDGNKNSIAGNNVLSVLEDSYRNLWVGTYGSGITVINRSKNTYRHYRNDPADPHTLGSNSGWTILEDREKNVWIATPNNGLSLYDRKNDNFIQYNQQKGNLSGNNVISLYEDSDGFLWIGTDGKGLNRMDKKANTFIQFQINETKNSLSNNTVNCFCEDEDGNLWIGTNKGLNCLNKKRDFFTSYGTQNGLPHEKIVGILKDDKGNLWISTSNGLSKFNLKNHSFKNFTVADGLQSNEFKQAFCKSSSGAMYFGGINGFNEFFPDSLKESTFDPPLVITDFLIFNKSVPVARDEQDESPLKQNISETSTITIPYSSSVISFEFASLNYTRSVKKQYAYILEGFDKEWNYVGNKRTATYTNLNPGTYTFKVKGADNDGLWNEVGASVKIKITPPIWLTRWFIIIVLLVIAGSIFGFYRLRMNIVQEQKVLLEQKVNQQTIQLLHSNEEERKARLEAEQARAESEMARQEAHSANEKLKIRNTEMEQFGYIASHDLQEPLRTTSSFVKLLQKQYKGSLDQKADTYFNYILEASERMKVLIKNLLDFSQIGNKKELEAVDCDKVLQNVLADLGIAISESGADIKSDTLPVISGYPIEMKQLFQNLITNAVKFRKKGIVPQIKISAQKVKDEWQFAFKDNGIGIEKEHSEKIFNIFQRLHSGAEYEGSGIGLANCKKIVELHGGRIWIESIPGEGSTFYFTIHSPKQAINESKIKLHNAS